MKERPKNISYWELTNMKASEIKKKYKLNERQLEQSVRAHCNDAPESQMQGFYREIYDKK